MGRVLQKMGQLIREAAAEIFFGDSVPFIVGWATLHAIGEEADAQI
jgi:hypothetical protein